VSPLSVTTRLAACEVLVLLAACSTDHAVGPSEVTAVASVNAPFQASFPIAQDFDFECPAATLHLDYAGTIAIAEFYDRTGAPVRFTVRISVMGTVTNLSTGLAVRDDQNITVMYDLIGGTHSINGGAARVTAPGRGVVLHDAGRLVFDENGVPAFLAGPHAFAGDQVAAYCAALT
jgi:hypothetical protein